MKQDQFMANRQMYLSANDSRAAGKIYKELYKNAMLNLYKSGLSEDDKKDIAQEAIISAFHALTRYNPEFKYSTWFGKIVNNKLIDWKRKVNTRGGCNNFSINQSFLGKEGKSPGYQIADDAKSPIEYMNTEYLKSVLYSRIARLPEGNMKKVIMLHVYEEKANHEIMKELNLSKEMVSTLIHRFKHDYSKRV